jgi:hypothetical protein
MTMIEMILIVMGTVTYYLTEDRVIKKQFNVFPFNLGTRLC